LIDTDFSWTKRGLIYSLDDRLPWAKSHTQIPTSYLYDPERIRIFFSARDKKNQSHTTFLDVNSRNPKKILKISSEPILQLGAPGSFDDQGIMPSSIVRVGGSIYLYYIGWNVRKPTAYHNAVGLAVSYDNGDHFEKMYGGPIMDRTLNEPFFCATTFVMKENDLWRNWYLSCTGWVQIQTRLEPRYHLKYAESHDGINWKRENVIAIDYQNDLEGGICRASVTHDNGLYRMWFCYRGIASYREQKNQSYRIGYAESVDGISWKRNDSLAGINPSRQGWDSFMQAYPNIIDTANQRYMFYNGNGFGSTGIGLAQWNTNGCKS